MHYINNDWETKKCLLDFIPAGRFHTATSILNKIINLLQDFGIANRVISITTDNGSNMLAFELEGSFFNLTFSHKRCAAHIINLAVKAGMKHLNGPINKLRKFVIKIRNSQVLLSDLKSICKIKNKQFLVLIQDVETRWNATYEMIKRQIVIKEVVEILINAHNDILKDLYLTDSEWSEIMVYNFFNI